MFFCVLYTVYGVLHLYIFHKCIKIHSLIIKFDGLGIEGVLLRLSIGNKILGRKIEFMYDFFISCDIYHLTLILIVYIYVYVRIYILLNCLTI